MKSGAHLPRLGTCLAVLGRLFREEHGQDVIEYSLLLVLIGLGAIASVDRLSDDLYRAFLRIVRMLVTRGVDQI